MTMRGKLQQEIADEFDNLSKMEVGSDQYKVTVDGLTKLMDRAIEMDRLDIEHEERVETREKENNLKLKQMKDERIDKWLRNGIAVVGIVVPVVVKVWGTHLTFTFEETGTIASKTGRRYMDDLLSGK